MKSGKKSNDDPVIWRVMFITNDVRYAVERPRSEVYLQWATIAIMIVTVGVVGWQFEPVRGMVVALLESFSFNTERSAP